MNYKELERQAFIYWIKTGIKIDINKLNHYLLKNFLKSAINVLKPNGKVIISIVDTPYYKGSFGLEDLNLKEYQEPITYKFNPSRYKGYKHTMTHKDENALEKYENFISLAFILK